MAAIASAEFSNFLRSVGVDDSTERYLIKRKLTSARILAACGSTEAEFHSLVVAPFLEGWKDGDSVLKPTDDDALLTRAALTIAYREACKAAFPANPPPILPAPFPPPVPQPPNLKPPTTLGPDVWAARIADYENRWTPPREFPGHLLLGAESVLARLVHEASVTRVYTPLLLHEIVQTRAYHATGDVNMEKSKREAVKTMGVLPRSATSSGPEFGYIEDTPDVRGAWAINDALEAVKWALVFAGWATTDAIAGEWASYFSDLVRERPRELDAVKSFYLAASWKLVHAMRNGKHFDVASREVIANFEFRFKHFERHGSYKRGGEAADHANDRGRGDRGAGRKKDQRPNRPGSRRSRSQARGRGSGRPAPADKRGRSDSRASYGRGRRSPSRRRGLLALKDKPRPSRTYTTHKGKEICLRFNAYAGCRTGKGRPCDRAHVCNICGNSDHGAADHGNKRW